MRDATLARSKKGAAWTIQYFDSIWLTPSPTLTFLFGYVVARSDSQLSLYLKIWLLNAEGDGTIYSALHKYWTLGQVKETSAAGALTVYPDASSGWNLQRPATARLESANFRLPRLHHSRCS